MNIVGIIPARGGSVGVPLKNIKPLNGKPLIQYTIECALGSKALDRVIVSTDHDEIARISKECGAEVPFKRPADISEDVATEFVLEHAVNYLEQKENYQVDAVMLLQPTSPFRTAESIKKCVEKLKNNPKADSVVTVNNVESYRPEWMLYLDENGKVIPYNTPFVKDRKPIIMLPARQSFSLLFRHNGSIYLARRDLLMKDKLMIGVNCYAIETEDEEGLDIDTHLDFLICETIMKSKTNK